MAEGVRLVPDGEHDAVKLWHEADELADIVAPEWRKAVAAGLGLELLVLIKRGAINAHTDPRRQATALGLVKKRNEGEGDNNG